MMGLLQGIISLPLTINHIQGHKPLAQKKKKKKDTTEDNEKEEEKKKSSAKSFLSFH